MTEAEIRAVLEKPIARELLTTSPLLHLAYDGPDGYPRNVPIGFAWDGSRLFVCSTPRAPKVKALRDRPRAAVSIDAGLMPPRLLLIRGDAEVEVVDGVPQEFLDASRKGISPEAFPAWEAQQRAVYDRMARIAITPRWARLIDFRTTLPQAVEEVLRAKGWRPPPGAGA